MEFAGELIAFLNWVVAFPFENSNEWEDEVRASIEIQNLVKTLNNPKYEAHKLSNLLGAMRIMILGQS